MRSSVESSEPRHIPPFPERTLPERYRKCRPSGKNCGNHCAICCRDLSDCSTCVDSPPAAETRKIPDPSVPENKMTPSRFRSPPPEIGRASCRERGYTWRGEGGRGDRHVDRRTASEVDAE